MDNSDSASTILDDVRVEPTWKFWRSRMWRKKRETQAQAEPKREANFSKAPVQNPTNKVKVKVAKNLESIPARYAAIVCFNCLKDVPNGKPFRLDSNRGMDEVGLRQTPTRKALKEIEKRANIFPVRKIYHQKILLKPLAKLEVGAQPSHLILICTDCLKNSRLGQSQYKLQYPQSFPDLF